jgi:NADPH2:quinone reductase
MKAILCTRYGGPDDLTLGELPDPVAAEGQVVVKVAAVALNFFDTLIIAGKYQTKPAFPFSPAAEFAGTVESIGAGVTAFAAGDRVVGFMGYGAARERIAIDAARLAKLPQGLEVDRAAGLIITYGTTYYALKNRAQLRPGETLAVLGAAGGTGLAAIELGKILGARVIACASSDDKLAFARAHGADETIDYAHGDLKEGLRRLTGGKGVDVIYDPVGGDLFDQCMRCVNWKGRVLVVGFVGGYIPKVPINLILLKGCQVVGVFYGSFAAREPQLSDRNFAEILQLFEAGKINPLVGATYPLSEYAQALRCLSGRVAVGKVVLRMGE